MPKLRVAKIKGFTVTVVCVIGWIWEKKQICLRSLALCAYEISHRTRIFPRICIRQQSASNIRQISHLLKSSKFECCRIRTSSHFWFLSQWNRQRDRQTDIWITVSVGGKPTHVYTFT